MSHGIGRDAAPDARIACVVGFTVAAATVLAFGLREPTSLYFVLVLQPLLLVLAGAGFFALASVAARRPARPRRARGGAEPSGTPWRVAACARYRRVARMLPRAS